MAVTDVDVTFANPDPNDCPGTFTELIVLLRQLVSGTIEGSFNPYLVQSEEPSVEERDYIWHKLDENGNPVGVYKFNSGVWRKTCDFPIGTTLAFDGDPTTYFDINGRGVIGGEWDGWQICNGNGNTENLADRMLIGAELDRLSGGWGYTDPKWFTTATGTPDVIVGALSVTLTEDNTYRPARDAVTLYQWEADSNAAASGGTLYGTSGAPQYPVTILEADAGNTSPDAIPIIPPAYAVCWVRFEGMT